MPKPGETWSLRGVAGYIYVGVGRDAAGTKYLIFTDVEGDFFLVEKGEFCSALYRKERVSA